MYHIDKVLDRALVKEMVNSIVEPEFVPRAGFIIAENDSQLAANGNVDEDKLEALMRELNELRPQLSGLAVSIFLTSVSLLKVIFN